VQALVLPVKYYQRDQVVPNFCAGLNNIFELKTVGEAPTVNFTKRENICTRRKGMYKRGLAQGVAQPRKPTKRLAR
jgi:hypothetical protein